MRSDGSSPNIDLTPGFLTVPECDGIVRGISASSGRPGHLVRAGQAVLDTSVRSCSEHSVSPTTSEGLYRRLTELLHLKQFLPRGDAEVFDGPYFLSYGKGSFFRPHRDIGSEDDPPTMRARRWSLVLYLNGRESLGGLPSFDGGALAIYDRTRAAADPRLVIIPHPGLLVLFRSELLHEVMEVREGTRYAVVGWACTSQR
jgi:predicted 2-oxoglutarate/Fe(II)-dependent dioxygenase YbiX